MTALEFSLFQRFMSLDVSFEAELCRNKFSADFADQVALHSCIFSFNEGRLASARLRSVYFMTGQMFVEFRLEANNLELKTFLRFILYVTNN